MTLPADIPKGNPDPDSVFPSDIPPIAEDPRIIDGLPSAGGSPDDDLGMPGVAEPVDDGDPTRERDESGSGGGEDTGGTKKKKKGSDKDPTKDKSEAPGPLGGGTGEVPGVLRGGTVTKVVVPDGDDVWLMSYEYPPGSGNILAFQFDSLEQVEATLGEDFWQKSMFQVDVRNENYLTNQKVTVVDSVAGVVGVPGTFNQVIEDLMYQTAVEMGITDPTLLGEYLSDPEIQLAIATASVAGWTPEQLTAEIRNTGYYQDTLYPGIAAIMATGETNPEQAWKQYQSAVAPALEILGYDPNDKSAVGQLLTLGVSEMEFQVMAPAFAKAANSASYAAALNQWAEFETGNTLDFDSMFDVFNGTTTDEIAAVVEKANIQWQADQAGFDARKGLISRIAAETELSEAELAANFDQAELSLLGLGDVGLRKAGLTQNDLIRSAFDMTTGDQSAIDIQKRASKFAREIGLMDDEKANLFVGFDPQGRPNRPGLGAFNPIGG